MDETKLTVFVCSTYSDLHSERQNVLDAIRELKLAHEAMEFFGARADQPIEVCLEQVRRSDVLIAIVGHRYGSLVPNSDMSFAETEYQEARRLRKECLVYMRTDDAPIAPRHMEQDPNNLTRLQAWKSALKENHVVAEFESGPELAKRVKTDLERTITSKKDKHPLEKYRYSSSDSSSAIVDTHITLLQSPDPSDRVFGIRLLRETLWSLDDTAREVATPLLIEALLDQDPEVVTEALILLADECVSPTGDAVQRLVVTLVAALDNDVAEVRWLSASVLARFGPDAKSAIERLLEALEDSEEWVREDAALALAAIGEEAKRALELPANAQYMQAYRDYIEE